MRRRRATTVVVNVSNAPNNERSAADCAFNKYGLVFLNYFTLLTDSTNFKLSTLWFLASLPARESLVLTLTLSPIAHLSWRDSYISTRPLTSSSRSGSWVATARSPGASSPMPVKSRVTLKHPGSKPLQPTRILKGSSVTHACVWGSSTHWFLWFIFEWFQCLIWVYWYPYRVSPALW